MTTPQLPGGTIKDPATQQNLDGLNLRLTAAQQEATAAEKAAKEAKTSAEATAAKFPVADSNIAKPVIAGSISAAGAIEAGSGFTVEHPSTGNYKISLSASLATVGVIVVTGCGSFTQLWKTSGPSKTSFTVLCNGINFAEAKEVAANEPFNFMIKAT